VDVSELGRKCRRHRKIGGPTAEDRPNGDLAVRDVMLFLCFIYVLLESRPNGQMSRPDA
jgi:hypothetical protein